MSVKINLNNLKMSGNSKVMTNAIIRDSNDDIQIDAANAELNDSALLLTDAKIGTVLDELNQKYILLDASSNEYAEIQKILSMSPNNKKELSKLITKHIAEFSQGLLANIVTNLLTK